jgi:hypothetical protein
MLFNIRRSTIHYKFTQLMLLHLYLTLNSLSKPLSASIAIKFDKGQSMGQKMHSEKTKRNQIDVLSHY